MNGLCSGSERPILGYTLDAPNARLCRKSFWGNPLNPGDKLQKLLAHEEWVRRLARHLVLDQDRAQDVAQQTWLEAMRRPPVHEKNLKSWLSAVARNAARKIVRSERARSAREARVSSRDEHEHEFTDSEPDAVRKEISALVASTKEPYRTVLRLRFYEELSPTEIAARLKVPLHTVYSRLDRALGRIESRLTARFGDRKTWQLALLPWIRWGSVGAGKAGAIQGAAAVAALVVSIPVAFLWMQSPKGGEAQTAPAVVTTEPSAPPQTPGEPPAPLPEESRSPSQEEGEGEDLLASTPEPVIEENPFVPPSVPPPRIVESPASTVPPPAAPDEPSQKSGGFKTREGSKGGGGNKMGNIKNPPKKTTVTGPKNH